MTAEIDENIEDIREAFVYVIGTLPKGKPRTYVGWTYDVEARLAAHNSGKGAKSTKGYFWKLLHTETFANKFEAMSREWYLKRDQNLRRKLREKLKRLG